MSDQVIAEIERSIDNFTNRVAAFGVPSSCMIYYSKRGSWVVSAHFINVSATAETPLAALSAFERKLKDRENQDDQLAATLGVIV